MRRSFLVLAILASAVPCRAATIVVTNTNSSGAGSLAQAITTANGTTAPDEIHFDIPGAGPVTIAGTLPAIAQPLLIDGYTQGDAAPNTADVGSNAVIRVQLDASDVLAGLARLNVEGDDTTIRGLAIVGIPKNGLGIKVPAGVSGAAISGCFIGVAADGTTDSSEGIGIRNEGTFSVIGGDAGARNVISGNDKVGLDERGSSTDIAGNLIGTDASATVFLGNGKGILASAGASDVRIGGVSNLIAGNTGDGIEVAENAAGGVQILGNRIRDNGGLAIDLGGDGVTSNDADDADTGANDLQNFPVLEAVTASQSQLAVTGSLDVPASGGEQAYSIRLYTNEACDESGHGEGEVFLGAHQVLLSNASESFSFVIPAVVAAGVSVAATATNVVSRNTSEFSACFVLESEIPACGDASGDGELAASDALATLRTAVGSAQCEACICDVDSSAAVNASDALLVLKAAVGQAIALDCSPCQ